MSYGFQQSGSGPPPPYQPGAPPSSLSYPSQPGAPQPGAPHQPGAPFQPPHQAGAPPQYGSQPGAPPQMFGAPSAPQYAPFPPPPTYQQSGGAPPYQQSGGAAPYRPIGDAPPYQPGGAAPPYHPSGPQPGFGMGPGMQPPHSQERCAVIRHPGSGLVLDGSQYVVKLQNYNGGPAQLWFMDSIGGGRFIIRNKGNGNVLDIEGGPDCGACLITYEKHGGDNQQWYINNPDKTIVSAAGQNLAIDICEGKCYPGTDIIAYDRHGGPNQQFQVQYQ